MLANMCTVLQLFTSQFVTLSVFEINLAFLYRGVFLHDQKSKDKKVNTLMTERVFKVKEKAIFIIFNGLQLKKIRPTSVEGENPTLTS